MGLLAIQPIEKFLDRGTSRTGSVEDDGSHDTNVNKYVNLRQLSTAARTGQNISFVYDADGMMVLRNDNGQRTVYLGKLYQHNLGTNVQTKHYAFNGKLVAMHEGGYTFLLTDHLGSVNVTLAANGTLGSRLRYDPWGKQRYAQNVTPTGYRYTAQRFDDKLGLYDYNARYYDPAIGRFISADTIVPDPTNPQQFNRFSYVLNNPPRFIDPSGHLAEDEIEKYFGFTTKQQMIDAYGQAIADLVWGTSFTWGDVMAYESNESQNGIGYAMLLLLEISAGSEKFRGAFWGIEATHGGRNSRGVEVTAFLGRPNFAEKSVAKTEYYSGNWASIPINKSAYGMGQDGNNMLAGTWYDYAFWRPALFVGTLFTPTSGWWQTIDMGWSIAEELMDDVTSFGHPLGDYLTVYPTIRFVNSLHPHHHNTYTFLSPRGIR